ncbi:hypothetical protein DV736_g6178, partial [Chaetothyriales sp. CBS 134916]
MPSPVCLSYRQLLHVILQRRVRLLQQQGRSFHHTAPANLDKQPVSLYWAAPPPTSRQLAAAQWFFETYSPRRLWTADQWRAQNQVTDEVLIPEVAFLGRSNVGKSSTLNALLNRPGLNPVGPKPGKTSVMTAWALAPLNEIGGALPGFKGDTSTRLTVLDVPGYGYKSHATWGAEVTKYLSRRKHLKKIFVLIDASHGLVAKDWDMFQLLRLHSIPHQVVATKCDGLLERNGARIPEYEDGLLNIAHASQIRDAGELIAVGSRRKKDHDQSVYGINNLRWSVLKAVALDGFAYEMYSKLKQSKDFSEEQPAFNAHNPFKQPVHAYKAGNGGVSKHVISALHTSNEPDRPPGKPPMSSLPGKGQLPPSHPRVSHRPFSLRRGLDTLLTPDQPFSQMRPGDVTPSASSYNQRNSHQRSLPVLSASSSSSLGQTATSLAPAARGSRGASPSLDEILTSFSLKEARTPSSPRRLSESNSSRRAPPDSPPADPRSHNTSRSPPKSPAPSTPSQSSVRRAPKNLTEDRVLASAIRPISVTQIRSSFTLLVLPDVGFVETWCLSWPRCSDSGHGPFKTHFKADGRIFIAFSIFHDWARCLTRTRCADGSYTTSACI